MSQLTQQALNIGWHYPNPGGVNPSQLETLEYLCNQVAKENLTVVDVGCWTGLTSVLLGLFAKKYNGKVTAIDWFGGSPNTGLGEIAKEVNILEVCKANIRYFDLVDTVDIIPLKSEVAVNNYKDETFDLVFIDADHRYMSVKQDILLWLPKVKSGGILCGHDCEFVITDNANRNMFAPGPDNPWNNVDQITMHLGVIRAVTEIFKNTVKIESNFIWWYRK